MTDRDTGFKALGVLEVKDSEKGDVEAVVGTLDVVDKDREVIAAGAIRSGAKVKLSEWGHNSVPFMGSAAPVGKGVVTIDGNRVLFRGKFFLGTTRGAEAFRTLKEMGPDQEWSIGYRILQAEDADDEWRKKGAMRILKKIEPFEVSPVHIGAGMDTRTVSVKCDACAAKEAAAGAEGQPPTDPPAADPPPASPVADPPAPDPAAELATKQTRELQAVAAQEYERFQRTFKRFGV